MASSLLHDSIDEMARAKAILETTAPVPLAMHEDVKEMARPPADHSEHHTAA